MEATFWSWAFFSLLWYFVVSFSSVNSVLSVILDSVFRCSIMSNFSLTLSADGRSGSTSLSHSSPWFLFSHTNDLQSVASLRYLSLTASNPLARNITTSEMPDGHAHIHPRTGTELRLQPGAIALSKGRDSGRSQSDLQTPGVDVTHRAVRRNKEDRHAEVWHISW